MKKPSGLPNPREFSQLIAGLDPGLASSLAGRPDPEQRPKQPPIGHNGHSLPGCVPGSHDCWLADQNARIAWLAEFPAAIDALNKQKQRRKESGQSRTRKIGRAIMNLRPGRSKPAKN